MTTHKRRTEESVGKKKKYSQKKHKMNSAELIRKDIVYFNKHKENTIC